MATKQEKILAASKGVCQSCGLPSDINVLLTGRRLHCDRKVPGAAYSKRNVVLLCHWCHKLRHGGTPAALTRVCVMPNAATETLTVTVLKAHADAIDRLAARLGSSQSQVVMTAIGHLCKLLHQEDES